MDINVRRNHIQHSDNAGETRQTVTACFKKTLQKLRSSEPPPLQRPANLHFGP
jgi:hypothetical protein